MQYCFLLIQLILSIINTSTIIIICVVLQILRGAFSLIVLVRTSITSIIASITVNININIIVIFITQVLANSLYKNK
ncbi:MAG TPA: hypothetical protein EYQ03_05400 [Nitrospinaceae bacterium]|nr:hypothetical protein [Nitrospinaceae bacterium]